MDWEEMNTVWSQLSGQLAEQQKLTDKLILKMTEERYYNRFSKLQFFETIGSVICFGMALLILFHFDKLNTWYLMASGIFTVTYLLALPIMVLRSLYKIRHLDISGGSYKDTLVRFFKAKKELLLIQRSGIFLNFILLLTSLPVWGVVFGDKDILLDINGWIWYVPVMAAFMVLFSRWGYRCYKGITRSAEDILADLEQV